MSDILYDVRLQGSMFINGAQSSYFTIELPKVFDLLEQHLRIQIEQEFAHRIAQQADQIDVLKANLRDLQASCTYLRRRNLIQRIRNK